MAISGVLPYVEALISALLIAAILLQTSSAAMGGAFGGDNFSAGYHTRRGLEKGIFVSCVVLAGLFAVAAFLAFVLQ